MTRVQMMQRLVGMATLVLAVGGSALAQSGASPAAVPTTAELTYRGASVQTQVDVNGPAAVQLLGSALDGLVAAAQEQAKGHAAGTAPALPVPPQVWAAAPVLGPLRDAIKSVDHVTVLLMKPAKPVAAGEFVQHYAALLGARGWMPLVTVRDQKGPGVATFLGPGGKGLFAAVAEEKELVVALVTTDRPLGEVLGQVMQAAAQAAPVLAQTLFHAKPAAPPAPQAVAPAAPSE